MKRLTILFLILAATFTASCRRDSDEPTTGPQPLTVACREPATLDPAYMLGRNDVVVVANLCTGLFTAAPDGGTPRPGLARDWSCSEDGLRCTFRLDPEARWSDGRRITAEDLIWSWRRVAMAETGSPGAETMHVIKGMAECTRGGECDPAVTSPEPGVLVMELVEPLPMLRYVLAHPRWCPVPRHQIEDHGEDWSRVEHYVGNGDYGVREWRRGVSMALKKIRDGDGPDAVELRFTDSEDTALRWFESGEVDVVDGLVPLDRVEGLRRNRPEAVRTGPAASVFYLVPNLGKPPMDEPSLRRAVQLGLDREMLVEGVLRTGQVPSSSIVPAVVAELSGYKAPAACRGRDLAAARASMVAAGYPAGEGLGTVEILYNQSSTMGRIMAFVQQDLRTSIGLGASLRSMEWSAFLETVKRGDFTLARYGLSGEPDPMDFLGALVTGAPNNIGGFSDPRYDALVARARATALPEERNRLLAEAEAILCEQAGVIPVYHSVTVLLAAPRVHGYLANHSGLHLFSHVTVED